MVRDNETARIVGEMLRLLLDGPLPKGELRTRIETESTGAYADAVGALRILGLAVTEDRILSLTEMGRYLAGRRDGLSFIVEAFRSYRTWGKKGGQLKDQGEMMTRSLSRRIDEIPHRETAKLLGIRRNAIRLREESDDAPFRLGLTVYVAAIDMEFERRAFGMPDDDWFRWPDTNAPGGDGSVAGAEFAPEGMLSTMGYRVGVQNGASRSVRREVLATVFEGALPPLFDPAYMRKWGPAGTAVRLRTLAYTIAQFAKNLKRRQDNRMDVAIAEYEQDLEFLYETYYVGHFGFDWPSTQP